MAVDRRRQNRNWYVTDEAGTLYSDLRDGCLLAVMMDIRDELQTLNALLHCQNFTDIPKTLRRLDRRVAKAAPLGGKR